MGRVVSFRGVSDVDLSWNEATGAIGDSVTVLPVVVAVTVLTDLSLSTMLVWFGVFQLVWGLYYGVPVSVEPMKAVAALVIAGSITAGELLVAGLLLGVVLCLAGATGSLTRLGRVVGSPVVRGIQLGVALVLVRTGVDLSVTNPTLAGLACLIAVVLVVGGYWRTSALAVLLAGGMVAASTVGLPSPTVPSVGMAVPVGMSDLTVPALEATLAQLGMTLGNAALATAVLLGDYFDRDVSPDELATSMGVMNLVAVPLGALPMCHGSGGVAGKYAFGARTAGANLLLGVGYLAVAVLAVELVAAYPVSMLGVVLVLVALQLGRTSLEAATDYPLVVAVGLCGLFFDLGLAFVCGIAAYHLLRWRRG
ncbi:sulfate transporter [Salinigranum rubrum]|uniref:Sulfate transporter n=1 Tax=Salinigranum rubrum TaxID=755307 RepID=A0A2I8VIY9_9EURY|nr:putative sulfate/molybdate transporter [Salinigranum rubrum]AUV81903.1 sulfate transporter [Salinigranum rubrum]